MRKTIKVEVTQPGLWLDADVTYAQVPGWCGHTTRDLKLSVLRFREEAPGPRPLVVWLCGGGWLDMDRNAHLPELVDLARGGYVVASVDYRTSNVAAFPEPLSDVKAAIRYLRANARRFQIDPDRVGVMGESAGGHLAAMAGVAGETRMFDKGAYMEQSSAVQAVCEWYGPTTFCTVGAEEETAKMAAMRSPSSPEALLLGGVPSERLDLTGRANPLTYLSEKTPPFLILHGDKDQVVPISESRVFYEALRARGVPADLYEIDGADHAVAEFFQPPVKQIIREFFDRSL